MQMIESNTSIGAGFKSYLISTALNLETAQDSVEGCQVSLSISHLMLVHRLLQVACPSLLRPKLTSSSFHYSRWGPNIKKMECIRKHLETQGHYMKEPPSVS